MWDCIPWGGRLNKNINPELIILDLKNEGMVFWHMKAINFVEAYSEDIDNWIYEATRYLCIYKSIDVKYYTDD